MVVFNEGDRCTVKSGTESYEYEGQIVAFLWYVPFGKAYVKTRTGYMALVDTSWLTKTNV